MQKKTLLIVLLILILTGGITATGLYIRKQLSQPRNGGEEATPEYPVKPQETVSEITPAEIDASDWKTYRNEEYAFEIKYPKSWYTFEDATFGFVAIPTFSQEEYKKYFGTIDEEKLGENYGLIHMSYSKERSLEEIFELMKKSVEKTMNLPTAPFKVGGFITEQINIDGSKGYRIYYRNKYPTEAFYEEGVSIVYLFLNRNNDGVIRFEGEFLGKAKNKEIYEKYAENFNRMLSTFRFIE